MIGSLTFSFSHRQMAVVLPTCTNNFIFIYYLFIYLFIIINYIFIRIRIHIRLYEYVYSCIFHTVWDKTKGTINKWTFINVTFLGTNLLSSSGAFYIFP